jgi:hypothetical protein
VPPLAGFFAHGDPLKHIGVDVRQDANNVLPCRCGGVAKDELFDVLGVAGISHGEKATVGIADEIELLEAELGANCLQIGDLRIHSPGCVGLDVFGFPGAALIVEDDLAMV